MNLEHCGLLSWFHERRESPAQKNHAQDCETLIGLRNQRPAILPWSWCAGWFHPSDSCGQKLLGLRPRATGTLPVIAQSPDCCWTLFCLGMMLFRKPDSTFRDHAVCAGRRNAPAPGNRMI